MKILHTTLLIAVLTFVNAQNTLAPIYYANGGNTCLGGASYSETTGYADGTSVLIMNCEQNAEGWVWPAFSKPGNFKAGPPYQSCLTVNYASANNNLSAIKNAKVEIWKCGSGRDQNWIPFDNGTVGLSSHPGLCLSVPNQWKVGDQVVIFACGNELFGYMGSVTGS